jgi:ubiquinone/menaquinone biosynthesis C-methylase UbiE
MIEKAIHNLGDRDNVRFIRADVESIPLDDNFFDIVICTNSFHHYLNPVKALKEMCRLMKKGGKIYILDPTADAWVIRILDKIAVWLEHDHVKLYSTGEFESLFNSAGLRYTETKKRNLHQRAHLGEK